MGFNTLTAAVSILLISSAANAAVFSNEPVSATTPAAVTSTPGSSEAQCLILCSFADYSGCSAAAFARESQTCRLSATKRVDMTAANPGANSVYRRSLDDIYNTFAMVGSRRFRVIQQRYKGSLSFARTWAEYENGFGDDSDFWIGLRTINQLTGSSPKLVRVEATTWSSLMYVFEYSGFTVGNSSTKYTMNFAAYLSGSSNTTNGPLDYHRGMKFSTMDQDNDMRSGSCSQEANGNGGWWYNSCSSCNPNGVYRTSAVADGDKNMYVYGAGGTSAALQSIRILLLE